MMRSNCLQHDFGLRVFCLEALGKLLGLGRRIIAIVIGRILKLIGPIFILIDTIVRPTMNVHDIRLAQMVEVLFSH